MSNEWISVEADIPENEMIVDVWIGIVDGVGWQFRLPYVKYKNEEFYDFICDEHSCDFKRQVHGVTHWIHISPPDTGEK